MTPLAHLQIAFQETGSLLEKKSFYAVRRRAGACLAIAMAALGAGQAQGQTFSTPGNFTWTCPAGVTSVQIQAWSGGGGSGGVGAHYASTGGGAGGSFVEYTTTVTPGTTYQLTVGTGGAGGAGGTAGTGATGATGGSSYFGNTAAGNPSGALVLAVGGPGSVGNNSAGTGTSSRTVTAGATATNSGNIPSVGATVNTAGTNGATPVTSANNSGAGGAGAGPDGSAGGGAGGAALTSANNGNPGSAPGGGGGGADQSSSSGNGTGANGGGGEIAIVTPIFVTGTPTPVSTVPGTASTPTDFTVTGSSLTANILLSAPTGFELSTSVNSGYSSSLTLTETSGAVAATTVHVRLAATDTAGSYSGNVNLSSGANAATEALPTSSVVTPFTQGDLAVEQLAANGTSSTFSILELNSSTASQAAPVNTYFIPATVASNALRQSNAGTTGRLATSNDGTLLGFSGFVDPVGTSDETTILPRAAASLSQAYQYTVEPSYTGASGNQTRGATYNNGTWYIADKGGLYLNGSTSAVNSTNVRPVKSFGGTVYALTQNASTPPAVIVQVSADGTTLTSLPGLPADNNATDFYMLSSGVNGSAFDILYVLDGATISKYSLVGGTWVSNGATSLGITGDGLCALSTRNGANLYLSTGATNTVVWVTDTAGYNAAPSINTANNVTLYTGSAGFLKGVVFAPLANALPDLTIAASSTGNSTSFSYTLTVANSGAANATGVTTNFTVPSGLTYVSATDNGGNGFTASYSAGVVSFSGGTLNANSSDTLTINVTGTGGSIYVVDAGTSPASGHGSAIINTSATTSSPITESNSNNNGSAVSVSTTLGPPSIIVTGTLSALSTSFGIASAPETFSVSGTNLSADMAITVPTGFEISTSSASGYAGSLSLTETGGAVPDTTIYVRLAAATTSGSYSGNVSVSSSGASSVNVAIPSSTVAPSANLSGIGLSEGSLTKTFAAATTSYTEYVSSGVTSLTLTPMADTGAIVTVNGASASSPVGLSTGSNTITISVTANSGGATQAYTINVVRAGALTPGNIVVSTYGNISVAPVHTDGQTTLITLEEFSPAIAANSSPLMAIVLPSTVAGDNVGIAGEYGSSSEGTIEPTADGLYLTIGGYSAIPALAYTATATAQSPCATVPRVAALIDVNGNCDTSSVFNDIYNTNNLRCVYSPDDLNLYLSGQGAGLGDEGGLYYTQVGTNTTNGGAAPTGIFNVVSTRTMLAYQGNLYYSTDQNSSKGIQTGIFEYSGLPTTSQSTSTGTTITPANNGGSINYSPDGFFFANSTTLYVADTGDPKAGGTGDGGIQKWVYNGSQWVLKYTLTDSNFVAPSLAASAAHGETGFECLAGNVVDGVAYLYAVSYTAGDADPNGFYGITDTVSATSASGQTFTEIAAAPGIQVSGTNPDYVFKGVSFTPTGSPVNTAAASDVTSTGATLNGAIDPNGTDTQVYFQYGTSTSYGSTTTTQDLGSGTSPVPFSISIPSGLQPGTTYDYQLVTVSNGLTSTYANQTFTTAGATTTVPTDSPTMPQWGLLVMATLLMGIALQNKARLA